MLQRVDLCSTARGVPDTQTVTPLSLTQKVSTAVEHTFTTMCCFQPLFQATQSVQRVFLIF